MSPTTIELRVIPRNLRWEVQVDGVTRRLVDWLCTRERAIEHAHDRALELLRWEPRAHAVIVVERVDRSEDERLAVVRDAPAMDAVTADVADGRDASAWRRAS